MDKALFCSALAKLHPSWEHLYVFQVLRLKAGTWIRYCRYSVCAGFYEPIKCSISVSGTASAPNPVIGIDVFTEDDVLMLEDLSAAGKVKIVLVPKNGYWLPDQDIEFGQLSWWS